MPLLAETSGGWLTGQHKQVLSLTNKVCTSNFANENGIRENESQKRGIRNACPRLSASSFLKRRDEMDEQKDGRMEGAQKSGEKLAANPVLEVVCIKEYRKRFFIHLQTDRNSSVASSSTHKVNIPAGKKNERRMTEKE